MPEVFAMPFWSLIPFVALLGMVALGPLFFHHWWEHHYPKVAYSLGAAVAGYLLLAVPGGGHMVFEAMVEYAAFIALIGSLYVISGGIHIHFEGKPTPMANTVFLAFGGVLANFVGTTGASMLLIRPFLRFNKHHVKPHLVVFFIFIVSNIGGGLTPIGDPPLFLGYLKGVPFFWMVEHAILPWVITLAVILGAFFMVDSASFDKQRLAGASNFSIVMRGGQQLFFLITILALVLVQKAEFLHAVPHAAVSLVVAALMGATAWMSVKKADKAILAENEFNYHPLKEVAVLFVGIFLTMIPALKYLGANAGELGIEKAWQYFLGCGLLSAFLDNAPTYLTFLSVALGQNGLSLDQADAVKTLIATPNGTALVEAISLGAVFFGAVTYIGNGPNFMVKNIAQSMGVEMPSFLGYLFKYSLPVLIPVFLLLAAAFALGFVH